MALDYNKDKIRVSEYIHKADELFECFQQTDDETLLSDAITYLTEFLDKAENVDPQVKVLARYNKCLMTKARRKSFGGPATELDEIIVELRSIARLDEHPLAPRIWSTLSSSLEDRYASNPQNYPNGLRDAVFYVDKSLAKTPEQDQDRWIRLFERGMILQTLYNDERKKRILEKAEETFLDALESSKNFADDAQNSIILNALANTLDQIYRHGGQHDLIYLQRALEYGKKALKACPPQSRSKAGRLSSMGRLLQEYYQQSGDFDTLREALDYSTQAVQSMRSFDPKAGSWLHNLSMLTLSVYERTGATEDLNSAISCEIKALNATPDSEPIYADRLSGLGTLHSHKFDRSRSEKDLNLAIRFFSEALSLTKCGYKSRTGFLNNLGNQLVKKFKVSTSVAEISRALHCFDEAINLSRDSPHRLTYWNNMSLALHAAYESSQDQLFLSTSIEILHQGLKEASLHHPLRPQVLSALAAAYSDLSMIHTCTPTASSVYGGTALKVFLEVYQSDFAPPLLRIQAAHLASDVYVSHRQIKKARMLLMKALELFPLVTSRALDIEDQQHILSRLANFVSILASATLEDTDEIDLALELLDEGRGIILGNLLRNDASLSLLKTGDDKSAALATRFHVLQSRLQEATMETLNGISIAEYKRKIEQDLRASVDEIRSIPGFERFQTTLKIDEIMQAAKGRVIIVINVTSLRADAFIITERSVNIFELRTVEYEDTITHIRNFRSRVLGAKADRQNRLMRESLTWLWDHVVNPVFQYMQLTPPARNRRRPRISWICTGAMSNAPVHAATNYRVRDGHSTALRFCLPSHGSTIKTIASTQDDLTDSDAQDPAVRFLGVKMATTPGKKQPLQGLDQEFEAVKSNLPVGSTATELPQPSSDQLVSALPDSNIVHFACHGESHPNNPSKSCLIFQKSPLKADSTAQIQRGSPMNEAYSEQDNPVRDELSVATISKLHLPKAHLAVLSACTSAVNEAVPLADEAIHIASMMQIAGYKHVIGTLWEAKNKACIDFADGFYKKLFTFNENPAGSRPNASWREKIPEAYVHAVELLQDKYWMAPLTWAPFVHCG